MILFVSLNLFACVDKQMHKNEIQFNIDEFTDTDQLVRISGWAMVEGQKSSENQVSVVLNKKGESQTLPALKEDRKDVAERYGKLYTNSGFLFAINKNYLDSGSYAVEILIIQGNEKIRKETELVIKVDKEKVQPFKTGTEWIESYHLGDSKLIDYHEDVITFTTSGHLLYKKNNEKLKELSPPVSASWLNIEKINSEKAAIITGSFEKNRIEVHEVTLKDGKSKLLSTIEKGGNLKIDPSILVTNDGYYATFTEIEGNINRSDPKLENGLYTIKLYYSPDLQTWNYVQTILSEKKNLEDGGLFIDNTGFMQFLYEEEDIDRGHSSIKIVSSLDKGKSWGNPKVLLSNSADHEPAELITRDDGKYYFFYSSDLENNGTGSYSFATIKYAVLDSSLNVIRKDIIVDPDRGASLYDVILKNNKMYLLYAKDYDVEDQLVLISTVIELE
jgi:hypothetical protein